jgi:hypothetical protein
MEVAFGLESLTLSLFCTQNGKRSSATALCGLESAKGKNPHFPGEFVKGLEELVEMAPVTRQVLRQPIARF